MVADYGEGEDDDMLQARNRLDKQDKSHKLKSLIKSSGILSVFAVRLQSVYRKELAQSHLKQLKDAKHMKVAKRYKRALIYPSLLREGGLGDVDE